MPWRSSSSFWDPILLRPSCKDLWASEILRKFQAAFILYILNDTLLSSSQYGEFICSYFLKQFRRKDKILSLFSSPQAGVGDASFLLPSSLSSFTLPLFHNGWICLLHVFHLPEVPLKCSSSFVNGEGWELNSAFVTCDWSQRELSITGERMTVLVCALSYKPDLFWGIL